MPASTPIRNASPKDTTEIKSLAVQSGLFSKDEVGMLDEMLEGFFDGSLAEHRWIVQESPENPTVLRAAAYFAPEPFSDRMWNLYFLAVAPDAQGEGVGRSVIRAVEAELRARGAQVARTLIVETSSTDAFVSTRAFYATCGFAEEARVRQFYGPQDDKVVFWKSLVTA